MNLVEKKAKMDKVIYSDESSGKIYVTHVTVRQSLFFLVLRLFVLEVFAALAVIVFHEILFAARLSQDYLISFSLFMIPLYTVLAVAKMLVTIFIVVQWLEDYYEITTKEVIHRKGLFFHKEERFTIKHLGSVNIQQGIFGRLLHFGTISLFDWVKGKNVNLYLIHNPIKYHAILRNIIPEADREKNILRQHLFTPDDMEGEIG